MAFDSILGHADSVVGFVWVKINPFHSHVHAHDTVFMSYTPDQLKRWAGHARFVAYMSGLEAETGDHSMFGPRLR